MELPPHARRRAWTRQSKAFLAGITSACAEKRRTPRAGFDSIRNYLRMRGEEVAGVAGLNPILELPPHARRRVRIAAESSVQGGITSACAEKSWLNKHKEFLSGNYLRMRGEEDDPQPENLDSGELPPHARRRARSPPYSTSSRRNYLRMRGEEHAFSQIS